MFTIKKYTLIISILTVHVFLPNNFVKESILKELIKTSYNNNASYPQQFCNSPHFYITTRKEGNNVVVKIETYKKEFASKKVV